MKGTKEDVKRQKHSQASDEGSVPSSQESHPASSPCRHATLDIFPMEDVCVCRDCGEEMPWDHAWRDTI